MQGGDAVLANFSLRWSPLKLDIFVKRTIFCSVKNTILLGTGLQSVTK